MPARIAAAVAASGAAAPPEGAALVRCVVDSLACAFGTTIRGAVALTGREVDTVHVVGGGAQNTLLCRLTAQAVDRPVVAGPVEATALGNVLVQARTHGALPQSLDELRAGIARTTPLHRYLPGERDPSSISAS
jgi:rhamnulokinase